MGVIRADDDFIKELREVCSEEKIVLIFDEVMTGFRVAKGGAQELLGIKPDLSTFGKIIGGGLACRRFRRQKRNYGNDCSKRAGLPGGNIKRKSPCNVCRVMLL